ncbi:MAG: Hsp20/alpha crystallin family protein [Planctomycetota bacterium]
MQTTQEQVAQLPTRDPFQTLFGRLFGDAPQGFYGVNETGGAPRTNICETETHYELSFELPGLDEKDIHVHMQDHMLHVTAERKDDRETQGKRWHRVEHSYGQYSRTISLPQDATNKDIEAVYKQGLLTVTVPKQPEARPTKIQVRGK